MCVFFSHHKLHHALKAHLTIFSVDWLVYKHMIYTMPVVHGEVHDDYGLQEPETQTQTPQTNTRIVHFEYYNSTANTSHKSEAYT